MRRRDFIAVVVAALAAAAHRSRAQEPSKPARIGVVYFGVPSNETIIGLRRGLADKGYIEGRNLVLEERFAEGRSDRVSALVAEVLALPIDVLYTPGTQTALIAKSQTTKVPIVFQSGDPVGAGLVTNLAHPGGNLTGISILSGEYSEKWLELLKEAVPRLRRVGVLWNPDNPVIAMEVEQMRRAAPRLGIELAAFSARAKEIDISLAALANAGVEGLVATDDSFIDSLSSRIAAFAREHGLPGIAGFASYARDGLLMSYSVNLPAMGRRAAAYIDQILKGARPADLPVEQATEFTLRINMRTARALGLTMSLSLLARADEVIE